MEQGHTVIETPHTLPQTYLSIGQISELVSEGPVINLFYDIVLITQEALCIGQKQRIPKAISKGRMYGDNYAIFHG